MNRFEAHRFASDQIARGEFEGWLADRVTVDEDTGCELWDGPIRDDVPRCHLPEVYPPRPRSFKRPKQTPVRRVVWEERHGRRVREGYVIFLACPHNDKRCVTHTKEGTKKQAAQAAAKRGDFDWSPTRTAKQRAIVRARQGKLTDQDVIDIRRICDAIPSARGIKGNGTNRMDVYRQLGERYGVCFQTICNVARRAAHPTVAVEPARVMFSQLLASNDERRAA